MIARSRFDILRRLSTPQDDKVNKARLKFDVLRRLSTPQDDKFIQTKNPDQFLDQGFKIQT